MIQNITKLILLGFLITFFTGCEGWTTGEHPQVTAIKKIAEYADNNSTKAPDAGLYKDAGIVIDSEDINKTNNYIRTLKSSDVDTQEEIQNIVDNIDTLVPEVDSNEENQIQDSNTSDNDDIESTTTIENEKPIAKITANSPTSVIEGEVILLDGISSTDSDGEIVKYEWSEDGKILHTGIGYDAILSVKRHIIKLEVTDDEGATGEAYISVTVSSSDTNTSSDTNSTD